MRRWIDNSRGRITTRFGQGLAHTALETGSLPGSELEHRPGGENEGVDWPMMRSAPTREPGTAPTSAPHGTAEPVSMAATVSRLAKREQVRAPCPGRRFRHVGHDDEATIRSRCKKTPQWEQTRR